MAGDRRTRACIRGVVAADDGSGCDDASRGSCLRSGVGTPQWRCRYRPHVTPVGRLDVPTPQNGLTMTRITTPIKISTGASLNQRNQTWLLALRSRLKSSNSLPHQMW